MVLWHQMVQVLLCLMAKNRVPYYSDCWIEVNGIEYGDPNHRASMAINVAAPTISLNYEKFGPYDYPVIDPEVAGSNGEDRFNDLLRTIIERPRVN